MRSPALLVIVGACVLSAFEAHAEDEKARRAREELERQLSQLVGDQPTRVRIDFEPLDEPNYRLEDAHFELDGRLLDGRSAAQLQDKAHEVWSGDVTPGKHAVRARIVYSNNTSAVLSEEGGNTWKLNGDVSFEVHSGIEVQVRIVPVRDASQRVMSKRLKLTFPSKPVMLAKLEDTTLPPEPVKVAPTVIDTAVAQKVEEPANAAKLPKAGPVESDVAALSTRPRRASAKSAAAEVGATDTHVVEPTPAPTPAEPEAEVVAAPSVTAAVDAGEAVAVVVATQPEVPADETHWVLIGIAGAALTIVVLGVIARRRAQPPSL